MLRYNVHFEIDKEIEISVLINTSSEEREKVIYEARKKLEDRGLNEFANLECLEVEFLEEI
jgi:hypothetical protein